MKAILVPIFLIATLFADPSLAGAASAAADSLPMEFFGQRPVVPVMIDGHGPYRFILDTGAQGSVVDSALAAELKIPVVGSERLRSPAGGEGVESSLLKIGEIRVGNAVFRDVGASTLNLGGFLQDADGPRGVLSTALFQGMLLTLDYPAAAILFRPGSLPAADGAEIFQFTEEDGFPTIDITFGGVTVPTHLDTGSPGGFMLPGRYAKELTLTAEPREMGRARLVGREIPIFGATLGGEARFGKHVFDHPEVRFGEFFPAGNIGFEILRDFTVTLDTENHRVRLTRPAGAAAAPVVQPRRYGVRLPGIEGELRVAGVDPGSIADLAGVRTGDLILKMNSKETAGLKAAERVVMMRTSPLVLTVEREGKTVEIRMSMEP